MSFRVFFLVACLTLVCSTEVNKDGKQQLDGKATTKDTPGLIDTPKKVKAVEDAQEIDSSDTEDLDITNDEEHDEMIADQVKKSKDAWWFFREARRRRGALCYRSRLNYGNGGYEKCSTKKDAPRKVKVEEDEQEIDSSDDMEEFDITSEEEHDEVVADDDQLKKSKDAWWFTRRWKDARRRHYLINGPSPSRRRRRGYYLKN